MNKYAWRFAHFVQYWAHTTIVYTLLATSPHRMLKLSHYVGHGPSQASLRFLLLLLAVIKSLKSTDKHWMTGDNDVDSRIKKINFATSYFVSAIFCAIHFNSSHERRLATIQSSGPNIMVNFPWIVRSMRFVSCENGSKFPFALNWGMTCWLV